MCCNSGVETWVMKESQRLPTLTYGTGNLQYWLYLRIFNWETVLQFALWKCVSTSIRFLFVCLFFCQIYSLFTLPSLLQKLSVFLSPLSLSRNHISHTLIVIHYMILLIKVYSIYFCMHVYIHCRSPHNDRTIITMEMLLIVPSILFSSPGNRLYEGIN